MTRYALIELTGDGVASLAPHVGSGVRVVCQGTASQCLLAAAGEMPSALIHDVRLFRLPDVQRRVGQAERNSGLGHQAVSPAETN